MKTDLLPTGKDCPDCGGWIETLKCPECGNIESLYDDTIAEGYRVCSNHECKQEYYTNTNYCQKCKNGIIHIYYTPEQYEEIKGKPYPEIGLVWMKRPDWSEQWELEPYGKAKMYSLNHKHIFVIVQTAQPAPDADYRPGS